MNEKLQERHFRNLVHWQKGQALAQEVLSIVRRPPRERVFDVLGTQLLRSAGSVPANIAEGYGRFSPGAYRNHLSIARGSLFETQSWLGLLLGEKAIAPELAERLDGQCEELAKLLTARMRALDKQNFQGIHEEGPEYEV